LSTPLYGRITHDNYLPILTPEIAFDMDLAGFNLTMPPAIVATYIPGYAKGQPLIVIGAMKGGGTNACASLDGITFAVEGHPEAQILYFSTDQIPMSTGGTATTTAGRASVAGLAPGEPVKITATKPGCTVDMTRAPQTGRAPREADYLSVIAAYVND